MMHFEINNTKTKEVAMDRRIRAIIIENDNVLLIQWTKTAFLSTDRMIPEKVHKSSC